MPDGGEHQLPGLVHERLGFWPTWAEERFEADGWSYEGRQLTRTRMVQADPVFVHAAVIFDQALLAVLLVGGDV